MNVSENDEFVKDLVCGMVKPKGQMKAKVFYKGKTYFFCTEDDKKMFEADPESWIPKTEKELS